MSGMLSAIPKTPLYDRLASEGRLGLADRPEFGTNVIPLRIGREELLEGYLRVLKELYDPEAFFARTDALYLDPSFEIGITSKRRWWRISPRWLRSEIQSAIEGLGLFACLVSHVPDRALRKQYRKRLWRFLKVHRRPGLLLFYVIHLLCDSSRHALSRSEAGQGYVHTRVTARQLVLTRHPPARTCRKTGAVHRKRNINLALGRKPIPEAIGGEVVVLYSCQEIGTKTNRVPAYALT